MTVKVSTLFRIGFFALVVMALIGVKIFYPDLRRYLTMSSM